MYFEPGDRYLKEFFLNQYRLGPGGIVNPALVALYRKVYV
jgi:hypothetical protein